MRLPSTLFTNDVLKKSFHGPDMDRRPQTDDHSALCDKKCCLQVRNNL
jgi:hypothetical protein